MNKETSSNILAKVFIEGENTPIGNIILLRQKFTFQPLWSASGPNIPAKFSTDTPEEMRVTLAERGLRTENARLETASTGEFERTIEIKHNGDFNWKALLQHLHKLGGWGCSRSVICEGSEPKDDLKIGWDGDGADKIISATVNGQNILGENAAVLEQEIAWEEKHIDGNLHRAPVKSKNLIPEQPIHPANLSSMKNHAKTFKPSTLTKQGDSIPGHLKSLERYKDGSSVFNVPLRKKQKPKYVPSSHIENMKHVTSHVNPKESTSFRGNNIEDELKPNTEFTDHGFSGTSLKPDKARTFSYNGNLFAIHAPPKAKSYYLDQHKNYQDKEKELTFHPDTHYRVLGHTYNHTVNKNKDDNFADDNKNKTNVHRLTHLAVVGQGYDAKGKPDYSLTKSPEGKSWLTKKQQAVKSGKLFSSNSIRSTASKNKEADLLWKLLNPQKKKEFVKEARKDHLSWKPDDIEIINKRKNHLGWNEKDIHPKDEKASLEIAADTSIRDHLTKKGWTQGEDKIWQHPRSKNQIASAKPSTHKHHYTITHKSGLITRHKTNSDQMLRNHISKLSKKPDNSYISNTLKDKKGSLHQYLGVSQGQPLPLGALEKLSKSNHILADRAKLVLRIKRANKRGDIKYKASKE